jgi:hypothetical protein
MTIDRALSRRLSAVMAGLVPHDWRKFARFSVRSLAVAILIIGGWLAWIVRSAHTQRDAVKLIESSRGHVAYDWDSIDRDVIKRGIDY